LFVQQHLQALGFMPNLEHGQLEAISV
jgi:hypothetical protein